MKKHLLSIVAALIFISGLSFAQIQTTTGVIGKIFTKAQADQLYGPVLQSVSINTSALQALLAKSPKYIMFNIINGQLVISSPQRTVLSGRMTTLNASQPMKVFSTSVVNQLIQQGSSTTTSIEIRTNDTLTISSGGSTDAGSGICPPFCPPY